MESIEELHVSYPSPAQVLGRNESAARHVSGAVRDEPAKFSDFREPTTVHTSYYSSSDYIYDMMDIVTRMPPDRRQLTMAILQCIDIMESRDSPELK